jgi:hypothetical protein
MRASIESHAKCVTDLIQNRAAGRRFKTVSAVRDWIRLEFGLTCRFADLGSLEGGRLERLRNDGACQIVVNKRIPRYRQLRVLIHELAEWITLDLGSRLGDCEPETAAFDHSDPALNRHLIALEVEENVTNLWAIEYQPSSFTAYDRLRVVSPFGDCGARYTFDGGQTDSQSADPLEDACL